jgi:hypothetical protein
MQLPRRFDGTDPAYYYSEVVVKLLFESKTRCGANNRKGKENLERTITFFYLRYIRACLSTSRAYQLVWMCNTVPTVPTFHGTLGVEQHATSIHPSHPSHPFTHPFHCSARKDPLLPQGMPDMPGLAVFFWSLIDPQVD